ncbi:hypothetical protein [Coleofasciculus sp. E1-EBD-02]|uniref:hypothetical protein n=1 Tax=Coleofasciculus sp. E1-EBD-02 TaxID=3068481 RepID=UPI003305288E
MNRSKYQQAFRQAFDRNNPSILLQQGEAFLDGYALGDEIRELEIDPKREFAAFATVFIEVAKRSRTPADVLTNQKIDSLQKSMRTLHQRLDRLPTLTGIRTEIARLAAQESLLSAQESSTEIPCPAFGLAGSRRILRLVFFESSVDECESGCKLFTNSFSP